MRCASENVMNDGKDDKSKRQVEAFLVCLGEKGKPLAGFAPCSGFFQQSTRCNELQHSVY